MGEVSIARIGGGRGFRGTWTNFVLKKDRGKRRTGDYGRKNNEGGAFGRGVCKKKQEKEEKTKLGERVVQGRRGELKLNWKGVVQRGT